MVSLASSRYSIVDAVALIDKMRTNRTKILMSRTSSNYNVCQQPYCIRARHSLVWHLDVLQNNVCWKSVTFSSAAETETIKSHQKCMFSLREQDVPYIRRATNTFLLHNFKVTIRMSYRLSIFLITKQPLFSIKRNVTAAKLGKKNDNLWTVRQATE